jgi:hypothetical protein
MSRERDQRRELALLVARLDNALSAQMEGGADISAPLAALRTLAERAETGTPMESAALPPPAMPPEAEKPGRAKRKRRPNWNAVDKWAVALMFGTDRITRHKTGGTHGSEIRSEDLWRALGELDTCRRYAIRKIPAGECREGSGVWGAMTLRELGATMRTADDVRSCIRALRDDSERGKVRPIRP